MKKIWIVAPLMAAVMLTPLSAQEEKGAKLDKETKERIIKRVTALLEEHDAKLKTEIKKVIDEEVARAKTTKSTPAPAPAKSARPYLGIKIEILEGGQGIKVTEAVENGPAAKAGLKAGDVIVEVNGKKIDGETSFADHVVNAKPGDVLKIGFKRGDEKKNLEVTLGTKE